jgi:hypothetical protein
VDAIEFLCMKLSVYAIVSVLINSMKQSPEESNICSVDYACYGIPEFTVVFTGACHRSLSWAR